MIEFIFATHNNHKVAEVNAIFRDLNIKLVSLRDLDMHKEIDEDGDTLDENAWIKANQIYNELGGNVLAEDTGLEVDALDGAPGICSARYAGNHRSSEDNMTKLLSILDQYPDRSAQFRTILAVWMDDKQYTFEGIVRGRIAKTRSGEGGFGYDPVFIPEGYEKSFAVLSSAVKNKISHRARAFEAFKRFLKSYDHKS